jgi:hypothetical protein
MPRTTSTLACIALAAVLVSGRALADRQMDPELRGVIASVIAPTQCFEDKYDRAVGEFDGPDFDRLIDDVQRAD